MAPPRFTTYERIMRKLKGRLHLGASPHVTGKVLTTEEIDDVALDQEGYIEAVLGMIYETPLAGIDPLIGRMATSLIAAELMAINFQVSGYPSESSDVSNLAVNYRKDAESILLMVTAGYNISILGMPPPQQGYGITPQNVVLKGEVPRTELPDTVSRSVTVISTISGARSNHDPYGFFGVADTSNPFYRRALGAAPLTDYDPEYEL